MNPKLSHLQEQLKKKEHLFHWYLTHVQESPSLEKFLNQIPKFLIEICKVQKAAFFLQKSSRFYSTKNIYQKEATKMDFISH